VRDYIDLFHFLLDRQIIGRVLSLLELLYLLFLCGVDIICNFYLWALSVVQLLIADHRIQLVSNLLRNFFFLELVVFVLEGLGSPNIF
jgi:hypothetical protein